MKISCQSCGAKYTIADEKVRGRTVKIRCKKCSTAIVISGTEVEPPRGGDEEDGETRIFEAPAGVSPFGMAAQEPPVEWTVNVAEGDQRTVVVDELVRLYRGGVINDDTYLWKDGMEDWLPLGEVAELADKCRAAPAPGKTPSIAPRPPAATSTPAPAGPGGPALTGGSGAARRVEGRGRNQDLFGAGAPQPQPQAGPQPAAAGPHMMAERGENSLLFTLDAIRAPKPKLNAPATLGMDGGPTSGIVDIKSLAAVGPAPMDSRVPDDIMNIGGGSIMGSAALAAPVLPTTIEPEPPPPRDEFDTSTPRSGGNKTLIVVLAAALGLVIIAFAGYLMFGKSTPAATNNPAASATAADTAKPAATPTTAETAAPAAAETAAASATASAATPEKKEPSKAAAEKVPGKLEPIKPAADKTAPEKTAKVEPKVEEKPPEPVAAAGPFDRGAAVSALNSAAGAASGCKKPDGPTGTGRVSVTFAPSGRVTSSTVEGPPFAGTSVGGCVAARFRSASVPPFSGSPVTVHKSFTIN